MNAVVRLLPASVTRGAYLAILGVATLVVALVFSATTAMAGLSFDMFLEGAPPVAILNIAGLAILFFPAIAVALNSLANRRTRAAWVLPVYVAGVFAVMAVFFGKPIPLNEGPSALKLLPTALSLLLCAWIMAEVSVSRRERLADAPATS